MPILRRLPFIAAPLLCLTLVGCDGDEDTGDEGNDDAASSVCAEETRTDAFAIALAKTGERHTVTVADAMPAEPIRGDNAWTVLVTDASGAAMTGLTMTAAGWMPDHGHGSPVETIVTELGDGEYEMTPLNLFMAGYWEVTVELTDADGTADEVMFAVCVE